MDGADAVPDRILYVDPVRTRLRVARRWRQNASRCGHHFDFFFVEFPGGDSRHRRRWMGVDDAKAL